MPTPARHALHLAILAAAIMIPTRTIVGHGMIPRDTPIDRIVSNLTQYVAAHPDDPMGYYRLGRAHTLALETKTEFVLAFERGESFDPAEGSWSTRALQRDKKPEKATPEQLKTHLTEAIGNLEKAIAMQPDDGRFRLTLACALEVGLPMMDDVDVWPLCPVADVTEPRGERRRYLGYYRERLDAITEDPAVVDALISSMRQSERSRDGIMTLAYARRDRPGFAGAAGKLRRADWREQIETQFFTAMCYALPNDGRATEKPMWGGMRDWVAYEAGEDFIRVVETRGPRDTDAIRLRVARETIAAFDDLPRPRGITPIVLDFSGRSLADVESPRVTTFDLDGTGRPQRWTWVVPDAGIVVWDPAGTGRVASGRQLFGSVSWWIFFDDGYQALDALDDDRDGELAGRELEGLAVWFDRNANGASDPGEVTPARQLGIAGISCHATGRQGASPVNPTGVRTTDGRRLPTFDWIATPVDE